MIDLHMHSIYYWHFYGREDFLVLKYNPWLSIYMYNKLSTKELVDIRFRKKEIIIKWCRIILKIFKEHGLTIMFSNLKYRIES